MHCDILGGDFNLEFTNGLSRCAILNSFIKDAELHLCDSGDITYTYYCETRKARSYIDHFFVSKSMADKVVGCQVIDSSINFSDHLPLTLQCSSLPTCSLQARKLRTPAANHKSKRYRWDKADLISYYYATLFHLSSSVDVSRIVDLCKCPAGCQCDKCVH